MYASNFIFGAFLEWSRENKVYTSVASHLILFLFENLDAMYCAVNEFPECWSHGKRLNIKCGGTNSMVLSTTLLPIEMVRLKAAISLSGDIYLILKGLLSLELKGLKPYINSLYLKLEQLRSLRNFFAHLDERIENLNKHGISGEHETNCGISYTNTSKGCFHMVISDNYFHFSDKGIPKEVDISKKNFLGIIQSSRPIYEELTSHYLPEFIKKYPESKLIYS